MHLTHSVLPKKVLKAYLLTTLLLVSTQLFAQVVIPPQGTQPPQPGPSIQNQPFNLGSVPQHLHLPNQAGQGQPQIAISEILGEADLETHRSITRLGPLWPYYLVAAILGLLLLFIVIFSLIKRKKRPKAIPVIPADIRALSGLESLIPLIEEAKAREFSYGASEIMRTYIEERFGIQARNRTTREFLQLATQEDALLPSKHESSINEFLKYCDLAKFAKQVMQPDQLRNMLNAASEFIKDTRPSIMASHGPSQSETVNTEAKE